MCVRARVGGGGSGWPGCRGTGSWGLAVAGHGAAAALSEEDDATDKGQDMVTTGTTISRSTARISWLSHLTSCMLDRSSIAESILDQSYKIGSLLKR